MTESQVTALAAELAEASARRQFVPVLPSSRFDGFDLESAYAVEAQRARSRRAVGHLTVGRKVGYANKALWRVLKLDTLLWAHMYDDTVRYAEGNTATLSVAPLIAPKIEPEIVFKLRTPLAPGADAAGVLAAVEWLALGFEIVDCPFPDWKYQPVDFVAGFGFHAGLVVGDPLRVDAGNVEAIADALPRFALRLARDHQAVDEGSGKNSLRSPALCLGELATALSRQPNASPLTAGELVSTGSLTEAHPIAPGQTWTASVEGLELAALTLRTT